MRSLYTLIAVFFFCGILKAQESLNTELLYHWADEELPASFFHNNTYNEIWGYAADGREYAIIGSTMGTHIFDITDPANAQEDFFIEGAVQGGIIVHRDYHDYAGYLYVVCDEGASTLQIIDLNNLPNSVEVVYDSSELFSRSHNIFIDAEHAIMYVCGGSNQLNLYSLEDPVNPTLLINCQMDIPGYSQQVGYVHDIYVEDNIAFCNAQNKLMVIDFSDLENPQFLGDLFGYEEAGYNHSGWLRPDGTIYAMADETHGTRLKLIDVTDYSDMEIVSLFGTESDPLAIAHNLIFEGNILHVSYYQDGYQVWDTTNPLEPERIAYYDTSSEPYANNYRGAWGIYPFLPSGVVLVSDMQEGLFVLQVNLPLSVEESMKRTGVRAFPNPVAAGSAIALEGVTGESFEAAELLDMEGKSVLAFGNGIAQKQNPQIEIPSDLNAGIYVLRIFAAENVYTSKIIVR